MTAQQTDRPGDSEATVRDAEAPPLPLVALVGLAIRGWLGELPRLLVPAAASSVLWTVLLAGLVLSPLATGRLHVLDHTIGFLSPPDELAWFVLALVLLLGVAGTAYVLTTQILIAQGAAAGRPVRLRLALRDALPATPAVGILLGLVLATAAATGAVTGYVAGHLGGHVEAALPLVVPAAWWLVSRLLVGVPAVILDRHGPLAGLRTAHLALWRRPPTTGGLAPFLLVLLTAAVYLLAHTLLARIEYAAGLASGTIVALPVLLLSPLWACLLTVVLRDPRPARARSRADSSARPRDARARPLLVLPLLVALIALPGLVLTALADLNPSDLPRTSTVASVATPPRLASSVVPQESAGEFPDASEAPTQAVHQLGDGRTAIVDSGDSDDVIDGYDVEITFCDRTGCPPDQRHHYPLNPAASVVGSAALPDGTVVLAAWIDDSNPTGGRDGDDAHTLRLVRCTPDGCPALRDPTSAPDLLRSPGDDHLGVDVAVTSAGRVVVAASTSAPAASGGPRDTRARPTLLFCADVACERPRRQLFDSRVPPIRASDWGSTWDLELAADGRPVLFGSDQDSYGADEEFDLVTIACDSVECRRPTAGHTRAPSFLREHDIRSVGIAVPPDGRPLFGFRARNRSYLLRCRTPSCTTTEDPLWLPDQGLVGLDLGPDGRPELAIQDSAPNTVTIASCRTGSCDRRDTVDTIRLDHEGMAEQGWLGTFGSGPDGRALLWNWRSPDPNDNGTVPAYTITTIPATR